MNVAAGNFQKLKTENSELTLSDRLMTCPACSRVVQVDDAGTLPLHYEFFEEESGTCPGSYTQGAPHRMLPEVPRRGFTFIELLPDDLDVETRKRIDEILQCAKFMASLAELGAAQLAQSLDAQMLVGIVQQTSRARSASLGLIK
jgi:hypothetical protein